jgi:hypothetical protein
LVANAEPKVGGLRGLSRRSARCRVGRFGEPARDDEGCTCAAEGGLQTVDMQSGLPTRYSGETITTLGTEYDDLVEHRNRLFALITEFQRAVARPRGLSDAIRILWGILPCSSAYFAVVESLLDKLTAAGAAAHRDEHRRLLLEIGQALDRCAASDAKPVAAELAHVLDALVMHEVAIRLRKPGDPT